MLKLSIKEIFFFLRSRLPSLLSDLRYWLTKQRVHKTLQSLPATSHESLPLIFDQNRHPLKVRKVKQQSRKIS